MDLDGGTIAFEGGHLRVLQIADVHAGYITGLNDPLVNRFLVTVKEQRQTMDTVCAYVRQNLAAPDALLLGIWRTGSPTHCGTVRLHEIDPAGTRAVIGVCIFDRTAWGRGTGGKAVRAATTWALDHLGIAEVEAGVYGDNVSSQRAFSKAGYEWTRDISDLYTLDGRPALVRLYVARGSARKPRS